MRTSLVRRLLGGVLAVLLVSGVAGAQTPTPTEIAATRVQANAGDADSQWLLGYYYSTGQGVPQDYAQAASWYRQAADQGHVFAQFNLGVLSANGQGVPQDYAEAVTWYRLSAEQGYADAQYNLGLMYGTGRGVPQDYVEAHKWRNLAASRASAEDQTQYAETRDAVATLMTPTQIEAAQNLAREWLAAFQKCGGK